jgi:hypothetical protein
LSEEKRGYRRGRSSCRDRGATRQDERRTTLASDDDYDDDGDDDDGERSSVTRRPGHQASWAE